MAEGLLRDLVGDRSEVASAGTDVTRGHPLAIRAMSEVGIDLGGHTSKTMDPRLDRPWDYVVTVRDGAKERCPLFPEHTTRLHWAFDDSSPATGTEDERLVTFRRVRDEIATRLKQGLTTTSRLPSRS
jgi:arsenate reductase